MVRAMMAGGTDYSHQSLDDITEDLGIWLINLNETIKTFSENVEKLQQTGYWDTVPNQVQSLIAYSLRFYRTSVKEITEILEDFQTEVQSNHVNRIGSLGWKADELNREYGKIWKGEWFSNGRDYEFRDYTNPEFLTLEQFYTDGRNMVADMLDLTNLAARLKDFVGRKSKVEPKEKHPEIKSVNLYVDTNRINELRAISSDKFDLIKLIKLCEELNICYGNECYLAVAMLTRAILDHIPPIFGFNAFLEVTNNYGGKSFKASMQNLQNSSRNIADTHLHLPIRRGETLPNRTQVNFSNDLDMLLAEIVRVLKR